MPNNKISDLYNKKSDPNNKKSDEVLNYLQS